MSWLLAQDAHRLTAEEFVARRLVELRLEALAARVKGCDHFLAITARDHYEALVTMCRYHPDLKEPPDWDSFQRQALSTCSAGDGEDLESYIAAGPYDAMHSSHPPTHFDI